MNKQVDMFDTVREYHHDGPKSEKAANDKRKSKRKSKCLAVLKELLECSYYTAGEMWIGKRIKRLKDEKVPDIVDLRRCLYILKIKKMAGQRQVRICKQCNVKMVEWFVTNKGRLFNEQEN